VEAVDAVDVFRVAVAREGGFVHVDERTGFWRLGASTASTYLHFIKLYNKNNGLGSGG